MATLLSDDKSSQKLSSKDSKSLQLPDNFTPSDVSAILDVFRGHLIKTRGFTPDAFQITLMISVVNAVLARYKVPLRLTSVIN